MNTHTGQPRCNRTYVELKSRKKGDKTYVIGGCNRTYVELKYS